MKKCIRTAAGTSWEDASLLEWDTGVCKHEYLSTWQLTGCLVFAGIDFILFVTDDFRIFCGDLGNEVNDDILARAFSRYPSFLKAKV